MYVLTLPTSVRQRRTQSHSYCTHTRLFVLDEHRDSAMHGLLFCRSQGVCVCSSKTNTHADDLLLELSGTEGMFLFYFVNRG